MFAPELLAEAEVDDGAALRLADAARLMVSISATGVYVYYGPGSGVSFLHRVFDDADRMSVIRAAICAAASQ